MSMAKLQQGCLLHYEDAKRLDLTNGDKCAVVVISHDCDLANEAEEDLEIIIGTVIDQSQPLNENSRNPRCLHLEFGRLEEKKNYIELRQSNKQQISKKQIDDLLPPLNEVTVLTHEKRQILKQWLAARYARPAFPNAFENRLRKKIKKDTVIKAIEKVLSSVSSHLLAMYFDLGKEMFSELEDNEPYFLSISIVYDAIEGGPDAREHAETTAQNLKQIFERAYGPSESATDIVLEQCIAIGDDEVRLSDLRRVYQWRLEHLSLQDDSSTTLIMSGQLPT